MPNPNHDFAIRRFQCRHIFTDGHRCGSPCLRGEDFCFYHHTNRCPKPAATVTTLLHDPYNNPPNQTGFTLPMPEDHSSVQHALGTIVNRLATNALDPRRAGLMLYALQIASGNLARAPRHTPGDIVQAVTLDPTLGPLAPPSELAADKSFREFMEAIERGDLDEDGNEIVHEEDEDEEAIWPRPSLPVATAPLDPARLTPESISSRETDPRLLPDPDVPR